MPKAGEDDSLIESSHTDPIKIADVGQDCGSRDSDTDSDADSDSDTDMDLTDEPSACSAVPVGRTATRAAPGVTLLTLVRAIL